MRFIAGVVVAIVACSLARAEPVRVTFTSIGGSVVDRGVAIQIQGWAEPYPDEFVPMDTSNHITPVQNWRWQSQLESLFGNYGRIDVEVTVTEVESGQSGRFVVPYVGYFDISERDFRTNLQIDPAFEAELTLGGTRFMFTDRSENSNVFVAVSPAVNTPEPGTAALAGVGLLVVVGLRRRACRMATA